MADIRNDAGTALSEQDKAISLFEFIKELNKLKQKAVLNMREHPWCRTLSQLPRDPEHVSVFYRDRVEDEAEEADHSQVLLSVRKPSFQPCPEPPAMLSAWLIEGWDNFRNDAQVRSFLSGPEGEAQEEPEFFSDDARRVTAFEEWRARRQVWADRQKLYLQSKLLFTELYQRYFELQRESETMEFIVANGVLRDKCSWDVRHPVLTKRAKLRYDPDGNTIYVEEVDGQSELYSIVFQSMDDVNLTAVNQLQEDLRRHDYHPLDRNETPDFLKALVHQLSSDSLYSADGEPRDWTKQARLLLYCEPCYIVRRRLDGTPKAIERIIEQIKTTGFVPAPIGDIVSGGQVEIPPEGEPESVEEQLAAVGGESVDILLSKEANKEQLEIANRIEQYNAVLVQGPPGTGKTHTIANLMGHFLAQGKSVLVTSHTPKALSVLKDKVAPGLRNLCVSVLEDSNVDMERSIDGITDYMSRFNSHELRRDMEALAADRAQIIDELAASRKRIFELIRRECSDLNYEGESMSPSAAAAFVLDRQEELDYIPGKIRLGAALPLSFAQLTQLYRSSGELTPEDERELAADLPAPEELLSADEFAAVLTDMHNASKQLKTTGQTSAWTVWNQYEDRQITFTADGRKFTLDYPTAEDVQQLKDWAASFGRISVWMKYAAVDGRKGGAYLGRWQTLIAQIEKTCAYAESVLAEQFGQEIAFAPGTDTAALTEPLEKLREIFTEKGKVSRLALMFRKDCEKAMQSVTINGRPLNSARECEIILHMIELEKLRSQCGVYWDELLAARGVAKFAELDSREPEQIANNWVPVIGRYLDWYRQAYEPLLDQLQAVGIPARVLFDEDPLDSDLTATDKILTAAARDVPTICDAIQAVLLTDDCHRTIDALKAKLLSGGRIASALCSSVVDAIEAENVEAYEESCAVLARMHGKYVLRRSRREMLQALEPVAPQWAEAIRSRRGIHGKPVVPDTVEDAWKWKQLSGLVQQIIDEPFARLQADSLRLSREYRVVTAAYAEKSAWYHLMRRTEGDIDMRHALQGWKQTVKKIGKGTGRNAPALKAKARELMSRCQAAVPGWIMPINRALESLDPRQNRFDVIIIDEASQSDVSSLAILYMGQKLIIVGDDKQVSPMAVGVDVGKMNALQQMYIQDKIPNAHLYDAKTSIYDIAKTTFQPLMLREHFRCVPQIIGFSNMLSYDGKIKPLREAGSSALLPAVVRCRVENGRRDGSRKVNPAEAKTIVALMRACMEEPVYSGKTFGVISLLGDDQVKLIQQEIESKLDPRDIVGRRILCGNASNFQGDERDVIFLSLVDSPVDGSSVHMQGFGVDDAYRKRYNVAASRARDQLWVVDSLDPAADLKPGDIRKTLIDYAMDPEVRAEEGETAQSRPESAFETGVERRLRERGYHLEHGRKVGAYQLELVAVCGRQTVAIECDGQRSHSGEARIREDMERQTILQRLGWRFVRIRGSEYFRDPERCMERVVGELEGYGIHPEAADDAGRDGTELLDRVKARAAELLKPPATEEAPPSVESKPRDVMDLIRSAGVPYVDRRDKGGYLWLIGGPELKELVGQCAKLGLHLKYMPGGNRNTNWQNGWWTK